MHSAMLQASSFPRINRLMRLPQLQVGLWLEGPQGPQLPWQQHSLLQIMAPQLTHKKPLLPTVRAATHEVNRKYRNKHCVRNITPAPYGHISPGSDSFFHSKKQSQNTDRRPAGCLELSLVFAPCMDFLQCRSKSEVISNSELYIGVFLEVISIFASLLYPKIHRFLCLLYIFSCRLFQVFFNDICDVQLNSSIHETNFIFYC